jgi:hypothetical protein
MTKPKASDQLSLSATRLKSPTRSQQRVLVEARSPRSHTCVVGVSQAAWGI